MLIEKKNNNLFLKSSTILGLIVFVIYLIFDLGLLSLIVSSDKSRISLVILSIYIVASLHWYYLSFALDREIEGLYSDSKKTSASLIINKFLQLGGEPRTKDFLSLLEDELSNRHALGYMVVDILLKLGLTGTVIGFILMLIPIGEIKDFDPQVIQQLLSKMSGGMAVALYTTLTGLITSILLKLQYFLLDSSLTSFINHLSSRVLDEE